MFVKEIEAALLAKKIDLAIHSAKDLASDLPKGLTLGPALKRAEPWDVLVCASDVGLARMPNGFSIGTSSQRRMAFLKAYRNDFVFKPLRGNVETRLKKVGNNFSGIILAKAALDRLGLRIPFEVEILSPMIITPAPGQGQLALEFRESDDLMAKLLEPLNHHPSALALTAERSFTRQLGLGCSEPIGAYCFLDPNGYLAMKAAFVDIDKNLVYRQESSLKMSVTAPTVVSGQVVWDKKRPNANDLALATSLGLSVAKELQARVPNGLLGASKG
jgi:hydroxymethylbilane synthase